MSIHFGDFDLDRERRQLLRGGTEVHLQPKAWALLNLLVDRSPAAVSKQEIYDYLWPDTFVSEVNLPSLIGGLRTALGDDAHEPALIRTIHGFGYAFCGETSTEQVASPAVAWLVMGSRMVPLLEGETIIGRDPALSAAIDHPTVSRRHAIMVCSAAGATVADCDSKNGTFVANRKVHAAEQLRDGDVVTFGSVRTVFTRRLSPQSTQTIGFDPHTNKNPSNR